MKHEENARINNFVEALVCKEKGPMIPDEFDYFGKLIGEWDFVNEFDNGKKVKGEWIFSWVLQGTAIQDLFISPSRDERNKNPLKQEDYNEYGTSIRFYNPKTNAWDIYYGNAGSVKLLEAKKENDKIVLTEVTEKKIKWIFSDIEDSSFHWQYTVLNDDGNWTVQGELWATRRA